ncbi:hypothetical protein JCM1841_002514 [Sporobolomyces salmonicolor]
MVACTSSHWVKRSQADSSRTGVIFHLEGPRLPYFPTGFGSGFAKAWRANVKALIGFDNPDREFFQILGIPNVGEYIDAAAAGMSQDSSDGDNHSAHASTAGDRNLNAMQSATTPRPILVSSRRRILFRPSLLAQAPPHIPPGTRPSQKGTSRTSLALPCLRLCLSR